MPPVGNGEITGTLCGKLGPACVQCGAVSEVLCDFPIGEESRTCDKPLCLDCAPEVGVEAVELDAELDAGADAVVDENGYDADSEDNDDNDSEGGDDDDAPMNDAQLAQSQAAQAPPPVDGTPTAGANNV